MHLYFNYIRIASLRLQQCAVCSPKGSIFITAGKRSAACGDETPHCLCLKGRTTLANFLPFRQRSVSSIYRRLRFAYLRL